MFPSDNPWNHPITDTPVAANSATLVASVGADDPLHPDFGTTYDGALNGIPYNTVTSSQPKVNVTIDAYPSESDLDPVPIPAGAVIEGDAPGGLADYQQLPSYAQASLSGQYQYTWNMSTTQPQAIEDPRNPSNRVASTWYSSTQFDLNLDITDGNAHRIALYLLDYDGQGRSENVSVLNPSNGQVLASQTVSNFSGGTYLIFDVTGDVQLQFTNEGGPSAVLSGLFFGAPGAPSIPASSSPAAAFVSADTTTQGSWQGVYGADGYFLPTNNGEGDRHLIVYDETDNIVYELFNAHRPSEEPDGQWHADSEAVWNLNTDDFRTPGYTSADAAGLPILPGLVRPDEVLQQGAIDHALRFTVPETDAAYVFPASHEAGVDNPNLPRMGERFRLNPDFDISSFPPADQVILQALKTYGMIVADNGSPWFISGTPSDQWDDDVLHDLTQVIGSDFQAVDLTPVVSSLVQTSGPSGTAVTVQGINFTGVAGQITVSFGGVAATSVTVENDNTLVAVAPPEAAGTVDVTVTTPYGTSTTSAADQFTYTETGLPSWLAAESAATWNASTSTLTVSGAATIIADPGSDEPNIVASGSGAVLTINPTTSPTDVHIGGITLTNGASIVMSDVDAAQVADGTNAANHHTDHNVLVIGTLGAVNDPTISIDSASKLDLGDNDLIVHTGSSDAGTDDVQGFPETSEIKAIEALAAEGRNVAPGGVFNGTWTGNGLTSSAAATADDSANAGYEQNILAVEQNSDMYLGGYKTWTVGSASETLGANDIIVKYTYNGDLNLDGAVDGNAATIFSTFYDNGATSGNTYAYGDLNGDGKIDGNDATIFSTVYGNGLAASGLPQL